MYWSRSPLLSTDGVLTQMKRLRRNWHINSTFKKLKKELRGMFLILCICIRFLSIKKIYKSKYRWPTTNNCLKRSHWWTSPFTRKKANAQKWLNPCFKRSLQWRRCNHFLMFFQLLQKSLRKIKLKYRWS